MARAAGTTLGWTTGTVEVRVGGAAGRGGFTGVTVVVKVLVVAKTDGTSLSSSITSPAFTLNRNPRDSLR